MKKINNLIKFLHKHRILFRKHRFVWRMYNEYCSGKLLYSYFFKECKICGYEPRVK